MNEEIQKKLAEVLLHEDKPSDYFKALKESDQLEEQFPEIAQLIGIEQNPEYHPEGDVFTHTMMVLDQAAQLRNQADHPLAFMLAALFHDIGKATKTTNENGRIRSIGHENVSAKMADKLLKETSFEPDRKEAVNLIKLHMRPNLLAKDHSRVKATNRLFEESVSPRDLILLAEADRMGRTNAPDYEDTRTFLHNRYRLFREKNQSLPE